MTNCYSNKLGGLGWGRVGWGGVWTSFPEVCRAWEDNGGTFYNTGWLRRAVGSAFLHRLKYNWRFLYYCRFVANCTCAANRFADTTFLVPNVNWQFCLQLWPKFPFVWDLNALHVHKKVFLPQDFRLLQTNITDIQHILKRKKTKFSHLFLLDSFFKGFPYFDGK